jgi:hypothetical protein
LIGENTFSFVIIDTGHSVYLPCLISNLQTALEDGVDEIVVVRRKGCKEVSLPFPYLCVNVQRDCEYDEMAAVGAEVSSGDYVLELDFLRLSSLKICWSQLLKDAIGSEVTVFTSKGSGNPFRWFARLLTGLHQEYKGSVVCIASARKAINDTVMFGDYMTHRVSMFSDSGCSIREIRLRDVGRVVTNSGVARTLNTMVSRPKTIERLLIVFFLFSLCMVTTFAAYVSWSYLFNEPVSGWVSEMAFNAFMLASLMVPQYFLLRIQSLNFQYADKRKRRRPISVTKVY